MSETEIWEVLKSYFTDKTRIANIQLESFNEYLLTGIPRIFEDEPEISVFPKKNQRYSVKFGQVYIPNVSIISDDRVITEIYPDDARKRDLNYETSVFVDIYTQLTEYQDGKDISVLESESYPHVLMAKIPIMVGSIKCNLYNKTIEERCNYGEAEEDPSGYLILSGKERAIISQERINYNQVYVFEQKISSSKLWDRVAEIRSMSEETGHSVLVKGMISSDGGIYFSLPYIKKEIDIAIVFKALGVIDFEKFIIPTAEMFPLLKKAKKRGFLVNDKNEALRYIGEHSIHVIPKDKQVGYSTQVLENELFPHLGIHSTVEEKCYMLGNILRKLLLTYLKLRPEDDRDNISNKRIESCGILFTELFRMHFKKLIKLAYHFLAKRPNILVHLPKINTITQGIRYSCATGNWGVQKNSYIRNGVSQILNRMSYLSTISHLRRVVIPVGKEGKNTKIRQLHPSQMMYYCVTGDTEILMSDGTYVLISNLKNGDSVVSISPENLTSSSSKIYNWVSKMPDKLLQITMISDLKIKCTPDHPFMIITDKEIIWKNAGDLTSDDLLTLYDPLYSKIDIGDTDIFRYRQKNIVMLKISKIEEIPLELVYDFTTVSSNHSFVANNFVTHNCLMETPEGMCLTRETKIRLEDQTEVEIGEITPESKVISVSPNGEMISSNIYNLFSRKSTEIFKITLISGRTISSTGDHLHLVNGDWLAAEDIFVGDRLCVITDHRSEYLKIRKICEITFNEFKERFVKDGRLWLPVSEITRHPSEDVYDFSVDNDYHSFIANGIVTHNCCGTNKNFTVMTRITSRSSSIVLREVLDLSDKISPLSNLDGVLIFVNGYPIGFTSSPKDLIDQLKEWRKISLIHKDVSFTFDSTDGEIRIFCDEGRLSRPLFTKDELIVKDWDLLVEEGKIIYLDSSEIEECYVALTPEELTDKHDYLEIHPSLMMGIGLAPMPFPEHAQAPRCSYSTNMCKQAISTFSSSYRNRVDTTAHVLHYGQKPLVNTKMAEYLGIADNAYGVNAIVAIMPFYGWSQEDAIVVNQSAIERGMFVSTLYKTQTILERKRETYCTESICLPKPEIRKSGLNYSKLDCKGIVRKGLFVQPNDVIVGRILTNRTKSGEETFTDCSAILGGNDGMIVDEIYNSTNPSGYRIIKIRMRKVLIPEVGDKFACYSEDTDVLTSSGWKSIKDLGLDDQVASLVENDEFRYLNPTEIMNYDYRGEMYLQDDKKVNLLVTPNHRMYLNGEITLAREICHKTLRYQTAISRWSPINEFKEMEGFDLSRFCIFLGIYLIKGSFVGKKMIFNVSKEIVRKELSNFCRDFQVKFKIRCLQRKMILLYLKDRRLKNLQNLQNREIPEWCFRLSKERSRLVIDGMLLGTTGSKCYTQSERLKDDIQKLALHAGWGCVSGIEGDRWKISIEKVQTHPLVNFQKQTDSWIDYSGKVYCCTVPTELGVIFVRRNGKSVWCGQSRHSQKGVVGMVFKQEDLPFTQDGIVPDICMSALSIPSRMTVSQLMESLLGKTCVLDGKFGDGTAFTKQNQGDKFLSTFCDALVSQGYERTGYERMINGITGEMLDAQIFIGPTYYQRLKHLVGQKFYCLDYLHEVLTLDGWKFQNELTLEDKIATLKDGRLVYENPIEIMRYPEYEGEMYRFRNRSIDLAVTGNHRMWVSKKYGRKSRWLQHNFEEACNIFGKKRKYKKDALWTHNDYQFILPKVTKFITIYITKNIEDKIVDMDSWLTFLGIWYAEGWASGSDTSGNVIIAANKLRVKNALYISLEKLGYKYIVRKDHKISIFDYQLYRYMKPLSVGASKKELPKWVFNLSKEQTKILINGLLLGDGYTTSNGFQVYNTTSIKLIDQIQQLCLHAGWSGNISIQIEKGNKTVINGRNVETKFNLLRIGILTKQVNPSANCSKSNIQQENLEIEKCPVFCVSVPSEVFFVRRNGKCCWTGNSRNKGNIDMLTRQPSGGRKSAGGLRMGDMEAAAVISHSTAFFLRERLFKNSDDYQVYLCSKCGNISNNIEECRNCKGEKIVKTNIPYSTKLLLQLLISVGIKTELTTG